MATKAKQSPDIQMVPEIIENLKGSRWMLSFDHEGKIQIKPIPPDACVMNHEQILEALNKRVVFRPDLIEKFMIGAIHNLVLQCDHVNGIKPVNDV